jgi:acetyl-CoA acyltransferase
MRDVAILGVGAHPAGKFNDKRLKDLGREAVWAALRDAACDPEAIEVAYVGNSLAGLLTGQEGIRGQVVLQESGIAGIPVINVENACASAATALRGAWLEVAAGTADVALALGVEKMAIGDTARSIAALAADSELELSQMGMQFTATYAAHPKINLEAKMREYGWTASDFAQVVVKNSHHGSLNPLALHRRPLSEDEVLGSRMIADPLTLYMCSSIADGAAAAVLCPLDMARTRSERPPVRIADCALRSGLYRLPNDENEDSVTLSAREAYETAGVGPEDIDVAEVHDAMAPAELMIYERLGFCAPGEGPRLVRDGVTTVYGNKPVNPSGGLVARGHPVGATGLFQICELTWQLRGEAGARQAGGEPKVALAQNQGGLLIGGDSAVCAVTILAR